MSVPLEAPAVEMLRGRAPAIDSSGLGNLEFRVLFHVYSFRVQVFATAVLAVTEVVVIRTLPVALTHLMTYVLMILSGC